MRILRKSPREIRVELWTRTEKFLSFSSLFILILYIFTFFFKLTSWNILTGSTPNTFITNFFQNNHLMMIELGLDFLLIMAILLLTIKLFESSGIEDSLTLDFENQQIIFQTSVLYFIKIGSTTIKFDQIGPKGFYVVNSNNNSALYLNKKSPNFDLYIKNVKPELKETIYLLNKLFCQVGVDIQEVKEDNTIPPIQNEHDIWIYRKSENTEQTLDNRILQLSDNIYKVNLTGFKFKFTQFIAILALTGLLIFAFKAFAGWPLVFNYFNNPDTGILSIFLLTLVQIGINIFIISVAIAIVALILMAVTPELDHILINKQQNFITLQSFILYFIPFKKTNVTLDRIYKGFCVQKYKGLNYTYFNESEIQLFNDKDLELLYDLNKILGHNGVLINNIDDYPQKCQVCHTKKNYFFR